MVFSFSNLDQLGAILFLIVSYKSINTLFQWENMINIYDFYCF